MSSLTKISRLICPVARSTRPRRYPLVPLPAIAALRSEEKCQVLGQQDILVEDDLAPRDLPALAAAPQPVLALADEEVGLGLDPVAVDQKPAFGRDLGRR